MSPVPQRHGRPEHCPSCGRLSNPSSDGTVAGLYVCGGCGWEWFPTVGEPFEHFSLDPVAMDLWLSALPSNPSRWICEEWLRAAGRDIYLETVESKGSDPLFQSGTVGLEGCDRDIYMETVESKGYDPLKAHRRRQLKEQLPSWWPSWGPKG